MRTKRALAVDQLSLVFESESARAAAQEQERLLKRSRLTTVFDFAHHNGLSYDDITYTDGIRWKSIEPKRADDSLAACRKVVSEPIPVISTFSGAGGFDIGAALAGYRTILAVDIDPHSCETLRKNKLVDKILGPLDSTGDLHSMDPSELANAAGLRGRFEGLIVGGPPCQSFSIAANQRFSKSGTNFKRIGFKDKRRGTLLHRFELVLLELRPAVFVLENVVGLKDMDGGEHLAAFCSRLRAAGYRLSDPLILNAMDFGVPQNRERLFLVGSRLKRGFSLSPIASAGRQRRVIDALARLPEWVENHQPRNHAISSILRYRRLEFGEREHLGRVDRLHPFLASKTVIAGGSNGGGRSHLHPFVPRTLTVRESARLQTFPDDYVFCGPMARQFTQVGNAVPPLLAYYLCVSIYRSMFR